MLFFSFGLEDARINFKEGNFLRLQQGVFSSFSITLSPILLYIPLNGKYVL